MAVVQAGSVGFIGLIIPHLLRLIGLRDYRLLIPAAVLAGGSLLVFADTFARSAFADASLANYHLKQLKFVHDKIHPLLHFLPV